MDVRCQLAIDCAIAVLWLITSRSQNWRYPCPLPNLIISTKYCVGTASANLTFFDLMCDQSLIKKKPSQAVKFWSRTWSAIYTAEIFFSCSGGLIITPGGIFFSMHMLILCNTRTQECTGTEMKNTGGAKFQSRD